MLKSRSVPRQAGRPRCLPTKCARPAPGTRNRLKTLSGPSSIFRPRKLAGALELPDPLGASQARRHQSGLRRPATTVLKMVDSTIIAGGACSSRARRPSSSACSIRGPPRPRPQRLRRSRCSATPSRPSNEITVQASPVRHRLARYLERPPSAIRRPGPDRPALARSSRSMFRFSPKPLWRRVEPMNDVASPRSIEIDDPVARRQRLGPEASDPPGRGERPARSGRRPARRRVRPPPAGSTSGAGSGRCPRTAAVRRERPRRTPPQPVHHPLRTTSPTASWPKATELVRSSPMVCSFAGQLLGQPGRLPPAPAPRHPAAPPRSPAGVAALQAGGHPPPISCRLLRRRA